MNDRYKTTARHPGRSLLLLVELAAVAGPVLMILLMFAAKLNMFSNGPVRACSPANSMALSGA